jgi:hypothetical protein
MAGAAMSPEALARVQQLRLSGVSDRAIAQRQHISRSTLVKYPRPGEPGAPDPETGLIPTPEVPLPPAVGEVAAALPQAATTPPEADAAMTGIPRARDVSESEAAGATEPPPGPEQLSALDGAPGAGDSDAAASPAPPAREPFMSVRYDRPRRRQRWEGWDDTPGEPPGGNGRTGDDEPPHDLGEMREPRGLLTDNPEVIPIMTEYVPEVVMIYRMVRLDWPPEFTERGVPPPKWADWVNAVITNHFQHCLGRALVLAERRDPDPEPVANGAT